MWPLRLIALSTALLASACASVPEVGPRPVAKAMSASDQFSLAAPMGEWPSDAWWRAYGDPQLDGLIEAGLKGAPTMARAEARLRMAAAEVGGAAADSGPRLNAGFAVANARASENTGVTLPLAARGWNDVGRANLDFSYELDLWRKSRNAVAAAASERAARQADVAAARLVVSTSIAGAYLELGKLYAERDVLVQSLEVRELSLKAAQRRFGAGMDSEADLRLAEAGPYEAAAAVAVTDEHIALTRFRIAALAGQTPDWGATINRPGALAAKAFGLPTKLSSELLARRPDLVAARWRAQAASHRIGQARAAFLPKVDLIALIGAQALGTDRLFDRSSRLGAAGAAISLPILDGGRRVADYRIARADYDATIADYDAVLAVAFEDVAGVVASNHALDARLQASRVALRASTRGWEISQRRYAAGAADYPSVLLAQDRMLANRLALTDLEARRFALDLALVRALGGGWREPDEPNA